MTVEQIPDQKPENLRIFLENKRKFLNEVSRQMDQGFLNPGTGLGLDQCHMFVEHQNPFLDVDALLDEWTCFYKHLGVGEIDFSDIVVPKRRPGFNRLIVIPQGLTLEMTIELCREFFPCYIYGAKRPEGVRIIGAGENFESGYALWARNNRETDPKLKGMCVCKCRETNKRFMKLIPRLLFELKFFHERDRHLDENGVSSTYTVCPDTYFIDEDKWVPEISFGPYISHKAKSGLHINWGSVESHDVQTGPREVIEN